MNQSSNIAGKSNQEIDSLWAQLQKEAVVCGEMPAVEAHESPWYVRVITGLSAWLASVFLLILVLMVFENILDDGSIVIGLIMTGGAWFVLRVSTHNDFLHQLSLALSFAGQVLIVFGLFQFNGFSDVWVWFLLAVLQVALALIMSSNVHRVLSSFAAVVALSFVMSAYGLYFLLAPLLLMLVAVIWMNELEWGKFNNILRPCGYGVTLAIIYLQSTVILFPSFSRLIEDYYRLKQSVLPFWMSDLLMGGVLLVIVWRLLSRHGVSFNKKLSENTAFWIMLAVFLFALVSIEARGITTGLVIILLGFANANRVLSGLGTLSLVFYIASYYYMLDSTLLDKSVLLAITGAVLTGAGVLLRYFLHNHREEMNHAQ